MSIAATALSVAAVGVRIATPSSGTAILTAGEAFASNGVAVAVIVGASTPLRDGDVVTAMAGRSTASWADDLIDRQEQPLAVAAGETLRFDVERSGQRLAIDVSLVPYPIVAVLASAWGTLAFVMTLLAVAVFAFWRRPEVPATGALLIAAVGGAGSTIPFLLGQDPLDLATGLFTLSLAPMAFVYLLLWAGLMDFALVFPRPVDAIARRPVLRSIPYLVVFGVYLASLVLAALRAPDALAWLGAWGPLTLLPTIVAFATLPVILIRRWRHGPLEDRRLLRAYAYVVAFIVLADLVIWIIPEALGGRSLLPWTIQGLTGLPFVLVIAASILRYRAFDIDVVVRRSLVYGGLTVVVVATYSLAAGLLGALLGGSSPFATSLLATGVAAIVALPVRDGLQGAATRLLYGDRDEPVRAIRRLGERLEWSVDPDTMPRVVVDAVADALRLPYVGLELGDGPSARLAAERGVAPAELLARPITFRSRTIGRLLVGARGPADPLSAADVSLLEDLTRQVGVAAHAALLTEDLRASRERIIKTREEERRRLRRDLHDGLGPALAAIGMRAEAAASLVDSKPVEAERLLAELRGEVAVAVSDIRRLVDGLRPPAIDELGLVGAVRAAADRLRGDGAPAVSVESEGALSDLPAAVEVAAYRIATEAMTNAVRHAGAGQCSVRLVGDADLTVIVDDDGRGLPAEPPDGVGLASMHERAAELGGECKVERRPTGGTRVIARLPLARSGIGP